jgi:hypothetical protein
MAQPSTTVSSLRLKFCMLCLVFRFCFCWSASSAFCVLGGGIAKTIGKPPDTLRNPWEGRFWEGVRAYKCIYSLYIYIYTFVFVIEGSETHRTPSEPPLPGPGVDPKGWKRGLPDIPNICRIHKKRRTTNKQMVERSSTTRGRGSDNPARGVGTMDLSMMSRALAVPTSLSDLNLALRAKLNPNKGVGTTRT